jgi:ABC-type branched-subunit amino acid transport system substrate-binding protein
VGLRNAKVVAAAASALAVTTALLGAGAGVAGATAAQPGLTANQVTVGQIDDISAPIPGLFKGAEVGTQAYFDYINSMGGVNGRKLKLDAHDSAFSSGTVTNEAQSIAHNDFAMVGGFTLLDQAEQSAVDAAKLPDLAQTLSPQMDTDPNVYAAIPVVNGGDAIGPFKWFKSKYPHAIGALGLIGSNSAATAVISEHTFRTLTTAIGYKWVYARDASFTETNFLSDIIKMKNAGVTVVFEPTQQAPYVATIAQEMQQENLDVPLLVGAGAYSAAFDPGSAGNGALLTTVTSLYMGEDAKVIPAVATFDKWAKKADPKTTLDLFTLYGWINGELFAQALKAAGPNPTRASLDAALNKITSFDANGLISVQNPAKKIPGQCWIAAKYENGKWERISPDPKSGYICSPGGLYPPNYHGISR